MEQLESEAELSDVATVQRFMAATNADLQQAVAKLQSMRVERDAARQERDAMHKQLHDMKVLCVALCRSSACDTSLVATLTPRVVCL